MNGNNDLTTGSVGKKLIGFVVPYLIAALMQTFYGMADLFVVGLYNSTETTTAVSIGSQVMHMLTVIILGFAMGTTVHIGRNMGAKDEKAVSRTIGTTIVFFLRSAVILTIILLVLTPPITKIMLTPTEAVRETKTYLWICFAGVPFIIAYNVISSIFRGAGDSKRPMYFVGIACIVNVLLDFILIGGCHLGAAGAAIGTICGQAVSVGIALFMMKRVNLGFKFTKEDLRLYKDELFQILSVGGPIALQDGLIQIAFIVITIIANSRNLIDAASVGIVEKLIGFMFVVPSAFLSALSAVTAQNMGAHKKERATRALYYSLAITMGWGIICSLYNQFLPQTLIRLFTKDQAVVLAGCAYMRSYAVDTFFAAIHFCFSGYFCGMQKSGISFLHNMIAIVLVRIPGAYFASYFFPDSLYPMGWAAPMGSLLSALICIVFYVYLNHNETKKTFQ